MHHRAYIILLATLAAVMAGGAIPLNAATFAYVSLDGENCLITFLVDELTGQLTRIHDIKVDGAPGALCVSPDKKYLFASIRSIGDLASFRINQSTGALDRINQVPGGDDPAFVATDRRGNFLLTAYYVASKVTVHAIGPSGTIGDQPLQTVSTAEKAHAILTDYQNRFAYVPHTGPNTIFQFKFDERTGRLQANQPLRIDTGTNTGPRQLALHPKLDFVYFDYEQGSAIAAFELDRTTGLLSFRQSFSSLPAGFQGRNSNARIEITPNGRFLYVANRGHHSLAGYAVDSRSGKLTPLGQTLTEPVPRGFAVDPTGSFLYAAGQASGKLAAFRIDAETGALARFATYEVGDRPWWVLVVRTAD